MRSKNTFWILFIIAVIIVGIFLYAARKNNSYGDNLETSIASSTNAAETTYTNTTYGFSISYPNAFIATSTFASSYLLPTDWNIYADQGTGEQVVAIEYPGSNDVLSSELRIGVSSDAAQVKSCDTFDTDQTGIKTSTHAINGEEFYIGTASDAAMSHFSYTESYRIVHDGTCYALDLVSFGTDPEVYSPPRSVPFDEKTAEAALEQVAESFVFTK
jgi:hypothetical protein